MLNDPAAHAAHVRLAPNPAAAAGWLLYPSTQTHDAAPIHETEFRGHAAHALLAAAEYLPLLHFTCPVEPIAAFEYDPGVVIVHWVAPPEE